MTLLDSAITYCRRGWRVISLPKGSKNPGRANWQRERWTEADLPKHFNGTGNIGVLLGTPSAGLIDVDLDCDEAIALADGFLLYTAAVFGRIGKPHSHRLYVVGSAPSTARFRDTDGTTLVELRSTGGQTVFPPSTHPNGEKITWQASGDPARVAPDVLKGGISRLAAAALLVRHWPSSGSRHDAALALAGGLRSAGFDWDYVVEFVELIARAAGDDELVDRRRAAETTFDRAGSPATGWPALAGIIGDDAAAKAREWFGTCRPIEEATKVRLPAEPAGKGPRLQILADVRIVPVRWLWPDRLPLGKLSLISGDPGLGKSCLTIDVAARISAGLPWPDHRDGLNPVGGVVLLSAEDDLADTVAPRLRAAGADLERVIALQGVVHHGQDGDEEVHHFSLERDLAVLEQAVGQCPNCRLIIIDPISAYLGETDSHRNAQVRGLLAPLANLAARHDLAVLCVSHLNKSTGTQAIYRTMESLAFVAAVRAAWCVAKDKEDPLRRLLLPLKANLCKEPTGLGFVVASAPMDPATGMLVWESEPIRGPDVDEALAPDRDRKVSAVDRATEWLEKELAAGPVLVQELQRRSRAGGPSWRSCQRARYALAITSHKTAVKDGGWAWNLPHIGPEDDRVLEHTVGFGSACESKNAVLPASGGAFDPGLTPVCEAHGTTCEASGALPRTRAPTILTKAPSPIPQIPLLDPKNGTRPPGVFENPDIFEVPKDWTREAWIEILKDKAKRCEVGHPELADRYRTQAAALEAKGDT